MPFSCATSSIASLIQCALGEVRVGKAMLKGQVVIRLAEVVAGRRRKQAKRTSEEQRVVTSVDGILVTTLGVVISDGKDSEDSSNTTRGTVDDEEGDMRRRGARECDEALMEATEARRGYARAARLLHVRSWPGFFPYGQSNFESIRRDKQFFVDIHANLRDGVRKAPRRPHEALEASFLELPDVRGVQTNKRGCQDYFRGEKKRKLTDVPGQHE